MGKADVNIYYHHCQIPSGAVHHAQPRERGSDKPEPQQTRACRERQTGGGKCLQRSFETHTLGGGHTLALECRDAPGEHTLNDEREGHAGVQSGNAGPLAGTLLLGLR